MVVVVLGAWVIGARGGLRDHFLVEARAGFLAGLGDVAGAAALGWVSRMKGGVVGCGGMRGWVIDVLLG